MTEEKGGVTGELPLVRRARAHGDRTAIRATEGSFTYDDLLSASEAVARALLGERDDLEEDRVAFLVPPDFQYAAVQWGIWRAGGIAVPMAVSHPPRELKYVLEDADPVAVVAHPSLMERLGEARGLPVLSSAALVGGGAGGRFGTSPDAGGEADAAGPSGSARRPLSLPSCRPNRRPARRTSSNASRSA